MKRVKFVAFKEGYSMMESAIIKVGEVYDVVEEHTKHIVVIGGDGFPIEFYDGEYEIVE